MKRGISTAFIILVCFVLQTTFFQAIALADVVPNLLIIITVAYGYMNGEKEGMLVGLCCGLLYDIFFGSVLGLFALFYMVIGYLNGLLNKLYYTDDMMIPLILIGASDFFYNFLYYICEFLLRGRLDFFFYVRRIILPEVVYTLLVSILLYRFLHMLNGLLKPADRREV